VGFQEVQIPNFISANIRTIAKLYRLATVPLSAVRLLLEKILSTLSMLHQCGIAHGAISVDNVVIVEDESHDVLIPLISYFKAKPQSQPSASFLTTIPTFFDQY